MEQPEDPVDPAIDALVVTEEGKGGSEEPATPMERVVSKIEALVDEIVSPPNVVDEGVEASSSSSSSSSTIVKEEEEGGKKGEEEEENGKKTGTEADERALSAIVESFVDPGEMNMIRFDGDKKLPPGVGRATCVLLFNGSPSLPPLPARGTRDEEERTLQRLSQFSIPHEDGLCSRKDVCSQCNPCFKAYNAASRSSTSTSYTDEFKLLMSNIQASQHALESVDYTTLAMVFSLSKITLASLFKVFANKTNADFDFVNKTIKALNDSLLDFIKKDFRETMTETNKKLDAFHSIANQDITTKVLQDIFPVGTDIGGVGFFEVLDSLSNDMNLYSVFAADVKEKLIRCVERNNAFIGNVVIRVFKAIIGLVDTLIPGYKAMTLTDFNVIPVFAGLTHPEFTKFYVTSQLASETQSLFTFLFKHRYETEALCVSEAVCLLQQKKSGTTLRESLKNRQVAMAKKDRGFFSSINPFSSST